MLLQGRFWNSKNTIEDKFSHGRLVVIFCSLNTVLAELSLCKQPQSLHRVVLARIDSVEQEVDIFLLSESLHSFHVVHGKVVDEESDGSCLGMCLANFPEESDEMFPENCTIYHSKTMNLPLAIDTSNYTNRFECQSLPLYLHAIASSVPYLWLDLSSREHSFISIDDYISSS